jgi:hypothetical protein
MDDIKNLPLVIDAYNSLLFVGVTKGELHFAVLLIVL